MDKKIRDAIVHIRLPSKVKAELEQMARAQYISTSAFVMGMILSRIQGVSDDRQLPKKANRKS